METCLNKVVTTCGPDDWVVGYDFDGDGNNDTVEVDGTDILERDIKANQLAQILKDEGITNLDTNKIWAGTTAVPAKDQSLPRRVAFLRHGTGLTVNKVVTTTPPTTPPTTTTHPPCFFTLRPGNGDRPPGRTDRSLRHQSGVQAGIALGCPRLSHHQRLW